MPSQGFERLIDRAVSDEAFAERVRTDVEAVLADYDLTEQEKQALRSRDHTQLKALGLEVDQRISKAQPPAI